MTSEEFREQAVAVLQELAERLEAVAGELAERRQYDSASALITQALVYRATAQRIGRLPT